MSRPRNTINNGQPTPPTPPPPPPPLRRGRRFHSSILPETQAFEPQKSPPGSLGLPILGEIVSAMNALRLDRAHEWIRERVTSHGPVFKTSFMGTKTVVMTGEDANKFIFTASDETLRSHQSSPIVHVVGKHSLFEYFGAKHKMVRGAMFGFLRPDSLQRYVPRMDSLVHHYLQQLSSPKNHPPGSLGLPILGEIVSAMNALRLDRAHEVIRERVTSHGPVFKTSFMGTKTVVMTGEDANKFIFTTSDETLRSHQSSPIVHVVGKHSLFEYYGAKHKMVRGAMFGFLRPDSLQWYVPRMDSLVHHYLQQDGSS
ncbi:Taxane 13-alpha-hydroxylase [Acorus calamus]|uniref:Taxane 13-alpha-hydroxylase n=1 Tax=Acorus calamus TaxID=4465 RepID=A0AAV9EPW0_ACOCL|nr:Taxane 13-alpha-hydroxylase [Acorus calamus]